MQYPERFSALSGYPFPRLRALLQDIPAGDHSAFSGPLYMSLGEPRHPFPQFAVDAMNEASARFNFYPKNDGEPVLVQSILGYLGRRFGIKSVDATNITPLNGTREGLYMSALSLFPEMKNGKPPTVLMPNPFYQVYMMGAKTLGLETCFVNATAEGGFLPNYHELSASELDAAAAVFICSPSNPQGAVADHDYLKRLILLAEKHDFLIFADECYSEIYFGSPPPSAFEIAVQMGADVNRVVSFHSLSKRSNMPGLRSGFAVSGTKTMAKIRQLRAFAGAPVSGPIQHASAKLWDDDEHVTHNRALYAEKMGDAGRILGAKHVPDGGFFLWLPTENGVEMTKKLWESAGIEVLPGEYLSADTPEGNPGKNYIRIAMVDDRMTTTVALHKIAEITQIKNGDQS